MTEDKTTVPHFSANRDDSDDWYTQGYEAALAGVALEKLSWPQKESRLEALKRGHMAGTIMRRSGS